MRIFLRRRLRWVLLSVLMFALATVVGVACRTQPSEHNVVLFVTDGLRANAVNAQDTPTLYDISQRGVSFRNSHSLFPTFTTANASAFATGHYLGDTGDFSNTINIGSQVKSAKNSLVPFLENNAVLAEINRKFGQNYLNEESFLASARKAGYSTAAVGKVGPVLIQDITEQKGNSTIIFDDATGSETGIPLASEITELLKKNNLGVTTPSRGENGKPGTSSTPGTKIPNLEQQQYFANVTTKVILPLFKQRQKPFVMVYWSRDPDGTQHNQGDSLNSLTPGINGPTSLAARKNVDQNLAQLRSALQELGLADSTNIFIAADHGFSTISKESKTSYAATLAYPDVPDGFLPPGFLGIDIANELKQPLKDPDKENALIDPKLGKFSKNGLIDQNTQSPEIVIAANGGSDLIYLPKDANKKVLANRIVGFLLKQDYISGLFIDDPLGPIPGTLPMSTIGLKGASRTPTPSIVVNFKSFDTGCGNPTLCGAEIGDTGLQQGQGMHGSFSRADTYNFMAAIGPDFKAGYVDQAPVGNADVAVTLTKVLNLKVTGRGKLVGRVLNETLVKGPNDVAFKSQTLESPTAANGLKTILKYQTVGNTRCFDVAGFPGRTLGL